MLQINELTLTHRKDLRLILEDFNLVLNDGDKVEPGLDSLINADNYFVNIFGC